MLVLLVFRLICADYNLFEWFFREERECPVVWSHICVEKLAELAKESTTMRRILDPMLSYFDMKKQWALRHGLALLVLSDMSCLGKSSGRFRSHNKNSKNAQALCYIYMIFLFILIHGMVRSYSFFVLIETVPIISLLFHTANPFSYLCLDTMFGVYNCQLHYKYYYKLASNFTIEYMLQSTVYSFPLCATFKGFLVR
jgi:hypothetical protein